VRSVRIGVAAVGLALLLSAPAFADTTFPPVGSIAAIDDLVPPTVAPGSSIPAAVSWSEAAIAARTTEVSALISSIGSSTTLPAWARSKVTNLVGSPAKALATAATQVPNDSTLAAVRQDVDAIVGLHIFAVLAPQVNEVLVAGSIKSSVTQLLAQEPSVRAAVAAAKSSHMSVAKATSELLRFHANLTSAKALVTPLLPTLLSVGSLGVTKAVAKLSTATATESTALTLVSQAKAAEQAIVTSLASRLGANHTT